MPERQNPLRIATLGVMCLHKGIENLAACTRLGRLRRAPFEFIHIGFVEGDEEVPFVVTGRYPQRALQALLRHYAPDIIWFPVRWPETFSYTLSSAMATNAAIVAPDIGAFSERLRTRSNVWLYPWQATPDELLAIFESVRKNAESGYVPPAAEASLAGMRTGERAFYAREYLDWYRGKHQPATPRDLGAGLRRTVVSIETKNQEGQIDACGYVRVRLPLTHPSLTSTLEVVSTSAQSALGLVPDAILVQRTAVDDLEVARRLVAHCRRNAISLIYEIDDDLFAIDARHPEYAKYKALTAPAKLLAGEARAVLVSTEPLRRSLLDVNPDTIVVPNALDERLWFDPVPAGETDDTIRMLYMGTLTHEADVALLEEPVRRLRAEFGERFRFEIVGVTPQSGDWFERFPVPHYESRSYPQFVRWLRSHASRWRFAVAPLRSSPFNEAKSILKALDYAALVLPGIFSDVTPYAELARGPLAFRLVANDSESWYRAIREAVTADASTLRRIGHAAEREALRTHTLMSQSRERVALWNTITSRAAEFERVSS